MDGYCSSAKLFSLFLPTPAVVSVFFNTDVQQKQCNCPNNNSSHPFSSQGVWQGRLDATAKLWVLLPLHLYLYTFQSSCAFLPMLSHKVHLSRAKWKVGFSCFLWTRGLFQDPVNTNTNSNFFKKRYNVQSWLPPSPWQNSRDSWNSCQLQPVRNVFGACFWAESVFPF